MRGGEEEGDISRFLVDDFISRVHARVREREKRMENFGEVFSPNSSLYRRARIHNKYAAKHERFFQNLLRSERVQGKRFR